MLQRRNRARGWCPVCRHLVRLTKDGNVYRHGYSFRQRGLGRHRVRVDTRASCAGSGQPGEPLKKFEWAPERLDLKRRIGGEHVSDREVDDLVELGFREEDVLEVMSQLGYIIGRTKDGSNEWWPPAKETDDDEDDDASGGRD